MVPAWITLRLCFLPQTTKLRNKRARWWDSEHWPCESLCLCLHPAYIAYTFCKHMHVLIHMGISVGALEHYASINSADIDPGIFFSSGGKYLSKVLTPLLLSPNKDHTLQWASLCNCPQPLSEGLYLESNLQYILKCEWFLWYSTLIVSLIGLRNSHKH